MHSHEVPLKGSRGSYDILYANLDDCTVLVFITNPAVLFQESYRVDVCCLQCERSLV